MWYVCFISVFKIFEGLWAHDKLAFLPGKLWRMHMKQEAASKTEISWKADYKYVLVNFSKNLICFYHLWSKPMEMDHFFSPNSEKSMDDKWLQQATVISLTPSRGFDRSIFVCNIFCDILWLMMWNNAYFVWWWSVIVLNKIQ